MKCIRQAPADIRPPNSKWKKRPVMVPNISPSKKVLSRKKRWGLFRFRNFTVWYQLLGNDRGVMRNLTDYLYVIYYNKCTKKKMMSVRGEAYTHKSNHESKDLSAAHSTSFRGPIFCFYPALSLNCVSSKAEHWTDSEKNGFYASQLRFSTKFKHSSCSALYMGKFCVKWSHWLPNPRYVKQAA